jgi:coenzyme F420-reducing hydrogenase gamma subunit
VFPSNLQRLRPYRFRNNEHRTSFKYTEPCEETSQTSEKERVKSVIKEEDVDIYVKNQPDNEEAGTEVMCALITSTPETPLKDHYLCSELAIVQPSKLFQESLLRS